MILSSLASWATLAIALAFPLAILRILWLLAHPLRTCPYCDRGYRGQGVPVLDGSFRPMFEVCSPGCADSAAEALWCRSRQP